MTHNVGRGEYVPTGDSGLTSGTGRLLNELCNTPVRVPGNVASPAFSATRLSNSLFPTNRSAEMLSAIPDISDPALNHLITHIAQQVGQALSTQLKEEVKTDEGAQVQNSGAGQTFTDSALNLTGVKLVMQSDVRESPVFKGDGSDKHSVNEWD